MYYRLSKNKNINELIDEAVSPYSRIDDWKAPWFTSMFLYNDQHLRQWQETGSLAGIKDNVTRKLWWDFDSTNLEASRQGTVKLLDKLREVGAPDNCVQIAFSGNKGFSVVVDINQYLTQEQVKSICKDWANDPSFDGKVYDNQRVFRLPLTRHEKSGLLKMPLFEHQLRTLSIDEIKTLAETNPQDITPDKLQKKYSTWEMPISYVPTTKVQAAIERLETEIEWSKKPKFLSNCRFSLQEGYFEEGMRNEAFICLAATYKNLGFQLDHVFRLLKGVAELQSKRHGTERYPDTELWNNVCMQVFNDTWNNGQYSCKQEGWLQDYCESLGEHTCKKEKKGLEPHTIIDLAPDFKEFAKNINKNTIISGLDFLDKRIPITTGMNLGILGAPNSGKSSIALEILSNTSKAGVKSVFASLDMHRTRIFEKIMYRISGIPRENLYNKFQNNEEGELMKMLEKDFKNVYFFNKSSPTVADIREYVLECQERSGEKIKLVMIDYFERVMSDLNDDTQSSKRIAGELQDMVNDLDIALITLVQPTKEGLQGGINSPLYDFTKVKGSGFLVQSFRGILSLWRPGYSPSDITNDKFLKIAILKNDLGELGECGYLWNGKRGKISPLTPQQQDELHHLEDHLAQQKSQANNGWN